jgi:hypothetical protein
VGISVGAAARNLEVKNVAGLVEGSAEGIVVVSGRRRVRQGRADKVVCLSGALS